MGEDKREVLWKILEGPQGEEKALKGLGVAVSELMHRVK